MKKITLLILCLSIIFAFIMPFKMTQAEGNNGEIEIATSPEKVLFNLTNLKPGDWAERTLTVSNNGKQDFKYLFSSRLKEGSENFFNELLLTISDKNQILFDGKMADLNKLDSRIIAKNDSEELFFKIEVPETLGNEFQGLTSIVEFQFYVEGILSGMLPADGPKLPETGTNMFNFIVTGAVMFLLGSTLQLFLLWRRRLAKQA